MQYHARVEYINKARAEQLLEHNYENNRQGTAGEAWRGMARHGTARLGWAWLGRLGKARPGEAGHGRAWRGEERHGRLGLAGLG